jgi:hypothetical protein
LRGVPADGEAETGQRLGLRGKLSPARLVNSRNNRGISPNYDFEMVIAR